MARTNASFGTGDLLSYADDGTPGNVNVGSPMVVGFGGWQDFYFLFSGRNVRRFEPTSLGGQMTGNPLVRPALDVCDQAICENRIYAVRRRDGDLLSYGDDGTPGNVSNPVVVGVGRVAGFLASLLRCKRRRLAPHLRCGPRGPTAVLWGRRNSRECQIRSPWLSGPKLVSGLSILSSPVGTSPVRTASML